MMRCEQVRLANPGFLLTHFYSHAIFSKNRGDRLRLLAGGDAPVQRHSIGSGTSKIVCFFATKGFIAGVKGSFNSVKKGILANAWSLFTRLLFALHRCL